MQGIYKLNGPFILLDDNCYFATDIILDIFQCSSNDSFFRECLLSVESINHTISS